MTTVAKGDAAVRGGGRLAWGEAWRYARLGGREEALRRGLIVLCSALATVPMYFAAWLPSNSEAMWPSALAFTGDPGLWPGIITALLVMALPAVHLAMLASRVGGPARDRRLAGMRSAGAAMADVRRVLRAEAVAWSALGALLGALLGTALLWIGSRLVTLHVAADVTDREVAGMEWSVPLLAPVWPHPGLALLAVLVIPLLATVLAPLAVRRVAVGIRGQAAEERRVRLRLPAVLLLAAITCALLVWVVVEIPTLTDAGWRLASDVVLVLSVAGIVLLLLALTAAAPVVAAHIGAGLGRGGGPLPLLAGRSMVARPMLAARASGSLVLVGLAAGLLTGFGGVLGADLERRAVENGYTTRVDGVYTADGLFYIAPFWVAQGVAVVAAVLGLVGIVVAVAEHVVTHRTRLARLVAGGVPRGVVARAMVLEAGLPAAVMGPLALLCGLAVPVATALISGRPELVEISWGYVLPLLVLLALAPFAAAWVGSRWVARTDDLGDLRDR